MMDARSPPLLHGAAKARKSRPSWRMIAEIMWRDIYGSPPRSRKAQLLAAIGEIAAALQLCREERASGSVENRR